MHLEIFASNDGSLWRGKGDEVVKTLEKKRIPKDANLIKSIQPYPQDVTIEPTPILTKVPFWQDSFAT